MRCLCVCVCVCVCVHACVSFMCPLNPFGVVDRCRQLRPAHTKSHPHPSAWRLVYMALQMLSQLSAALQAARKESKIRICCVL